MTSQSSAATQPHSDAIYVARNCHACALLLTVASASCLGQQDFGLRLVSELEDSSGADGSTISTRNRAHPDTPPRRRLHSLVSPSAFAIGKCFEAARLLELPCLCFPHSCKEAQRDLFLVSSSRKGRLANPHQCETSQLPPPPRRYLRDRAPLRVRERYQANRTRPILPLRQR